MEIVRKNYFYILVNNIRYHQKKFKEIYQIEDYIKLKHFNQKETKIFLFNKIKRTFFKIYGINIIILHDFFVFVKINFILKIFKNLVLFNNIFVNFIILF
jgi:hypothetical protein